MNLNDVDFAKIFSSITNRTPCTENRARNKRKSGIQPRTAALMQQLTNGIWAKLIHYHKGSVFIFTLKRLLSNIGSKIRWGLCLIYCGNVHYGDKYLLKKAQIKIAPICFLFTSFPWCCSFCPAALCLLNKFSRFIVKLIIKMPKKTSHKN